MKSLFSSVLFAVGLLGAFASTATETDFIPQLIIDTDLGSCMDDLFAIANAHRLDDLDGVKLLAVMLDNPVPQDDPNPDKFLDFTKALLHYYGHDDVPIGTIPAKPAGEKVNYIFYPYYLLTQKKDVRGNLLLPPPPVPRAGKIEDAVRLYRELLVQAEPHSIIICQIGFLTNLIRLLDSPADDLSSKTGKELIQEKVKELCIMAGSFDGTLTHPEFNVKGDILSCRRIFQEWPTKIICTPYENGLYIYFPTYEVLKAFDFRQEDPIYLAYSNWDPDVCSGPKSQLDWDDLTVLNLAQKFGELTLFEYSRPGRIIVDEQGYTTFQETPDGNTVIQKVLPEKALRARQKILSFLAGKDFIPQDDCNPLRLTRLRPASDNPDDGRLCLRNISEETAWPLKGHYLVIISLELPESVSIDLPDIILPPGDEITLNRKEYWPEGNIPNNSINILLYSPDAKVVQELFFNPRALNSASQNPRLFLAPQDTQKCILDTTLWKVVE